jgi:hypothetical protein
MAALFDLKDAFEIGAKGDDYTYELSARTNLDMVTPPPFTPIRNVTIVQQSRFGLRVFRMIIDKHFTLPFAS